MDLSELIYKPIAIVGSGRSGTTLLYRLLAAHPMTCWFTPLLEKNLKYPQLGALFRLLNLPLIDDYVQRRIIEGRHIPWLNPVEGEVIYRECGFMNDRKTTNNNLTAEMREKFNAAVGSLIQFSGRRRFLTKRTANTQRLELIDELFPDANYVHIIRDGRAVAHSLIQTSWWESIVLWWCGKTPKDLVSEGWEPMKVCATHWLKNLSEIKRMQNQFGKRFFEVRYEQLVVDVRGEVSKVLCRLDLMAQSKKYVRLLPNQLEDMNLKWTRALSEHDKKILHVHLEQKLIELGYDV